MNYEISFRDFGNSIRDFFSHNYLLVLIMILGSFLRLYKIGDKSLWMDELILLDYVINSDTILAVLKNFSYFSPIEVLLIYFPIHLGNNPDFFIRLPEAILGICSIYLVYLLAKELFNQKSALISAFIFSISPILIWYSQEGRPYSLFVFMSLLSAYFFIKALKDTNIKNSAFFVISTLLLLLTHSFAVLLVLVEALYFLFLLFCGRFELFRSSNPFCNCNTLKLFLSFFIIGLLFLPYFINSVGFKLVQTGLNFGNQNIIPRIYQTFGTFTVSPGYFPIAELFGVYSSLLLIIVGIFFVSLLIAGLIYSFKKKGHASFFLFLWLSLPIFLCVIVNLLTGKVVFVERYMLFCIPPYLIFISNGILYLNDIIISKLFDKKTENQKNKFYKPHSVAIIILILLSVFYIPMSFFGYQIEKQDWKGTAEYLNEYSESNDKVIFIGGANVDYFKYYYRGNSEIYYLPIDTEKIEDEIYNNSEKYNKIWLVVSPHNGVGNDFKDFFNNYTLEKESYDRRYIPDSGAYILQGAIFSKPGNNNL